MNLSEKVVLALFSLLFAVALPWLTVGEVFAQTPRVYFDPTPLSLSDVGASGTVKVKLENLSGSAGFEFKLSFDKSLIKVDNVNVLVPSAGVFPLKNVDNEKGTVSLGAVTLCADGVCPNILSGTPLEAAEITISAVGQGTSGLNFDAANYFLYSAEMGADGLPLQVSADFTNGQVKVGETPPPPPPGGVTINLSAGGNQVIWPSGLPAGFTSLTALPSIQTDCGSAQSISRKKNGWWESAVYGYGGANFALTEGAAAAVRVASTCVWTP